MLAGGYVDDEDFGDTIIYTGEGGRDPNTGAQIADQELSRGSLALVHNYEEGLPVRVVRGYNHRSPFAPASGYRYDGLFRIDAFWRDRGKHGFSIFRFRLERLQDGDVEKRIEEPPAGDGGPPVRRESYVRYIKAQHRISLKIGRLIMQKCYAFGLAWALYLAKWRRKIGTSIRFSPGGTDSFVLALDHGALS